MDFCIRFIASQLVRIGAAALAALGLGDLHVGLPFGSRWIAAFLILTAIVMSVPSQDRST